MQYLALIRLVLALLPAVIDAVKAIEAAYPAAGQGALKLDLVRGILQNAYDAGTGVTVKFDELWPVLQNTVASVVGFMNSAGLFRK